MIIDRRQKLPDIENQGSEPKCVGSAFAALAYESGLNLSSKDIYEKAKTLDSRPGEDYDGTDMYAGARAIEALGVQDRFYVIPASTDRVNKALQTSSLACSVWATMVDSNAGKNKSHAIVVCGFDGQNYLIRNSWGTGWGDNGYKWYSAIDLFKNLSSNGFWGVSTGATLEIEKKKKNGRKNKTMLIGIIGGGIILAILGVIIWNL